MTHSDWQQSIEGQRVMLKLWLIQIEHAMFKGQLNKVRSRNGAWWKLLPNTIAVNPSKRNA